MLELNRFKYNSAKKQKTEKKYKKGIDKEGKE
jgi:translation initiation factor IF-3